MTLMRSEIDDEYNIKKLQEKILEIAVYIDTICQEIGAKYFLMGGSALGAIRHGGFIPWDDDLDIFMFPEDYEKFKKYFLSSGDQENFYLQELSAYGNKTLSAKLRANNTTYIENATKDWKIHHGVFVDIFLLHNTPESKIPRLVQCLSAKFVLAKGQRLKGAKYKGVKRFVTDLMCLFPRKAVLKSGLKKLYKYDNKKEKFVCHFVGKAFFNKGIYDRAYFESTRRVKFENVLLNIPRDAEGYLTSRFGDYMKMPPKESITMAQHAFLWDTEKDFSVYTNIERDFSDECKLV